MATVSTGFGRSSKSSRTSSEHSKSKALQGNSNNDAFTNRSSDHLSDMWPRHGRHPPSPPVRQRARYGYIHRTWVVVVICFPSWHGVSVQITLTDNFYFNFIMLVTVLAQLIKKQVPQKIWSVVQKWLLLRPQASNRLQTLHHGSPILLLLPLEANNLKTCKLPMVKEILSQNSSK